MFMLFATQSQRDTYKQTEKHTHIVAHSHAHTNAYLFRRGTLGRIRLQTALQEGLEVIGPVHRMAKSKIRKRACGCHEHGTLDVGGVRWSFVCHLDVKERESVCVSERTAIEPSSPWH
jgi:hypothetical protein